MSIPIGAVVAGVLQTSLKNIYLIIGIAGALRFCMALLASRSALNQRTPPPSQGATWQDWTGDQQAHRGTATA